MQVICYNTVTNAFLTEVKCNVEYAELSLI